jgi:DNA-binding CsgD family transcriptional regulator
LSGGSAVDPYHKKDLPTKKRKSTKKKPQPKREKTISSEEIFNLFFNKRLTQSQIAKKLDIPTREIAKIFAKAGIKQQKLSPRDEEIGKLYYLQRMSKKDIAKKLGISYNTVLRTFGKYGWRSLPRKPKANPEDARRLYESGLTLEAVAKKLGVSYYTIANYLKELGVAQRRRGYRTDAERQQAKKDKGARHLERVKALRDTLFGSNCRICDVGRDKRKIAIHKKDCEEHDEQKLWRIGFLKKVNPDDWAALCIMCHRGAHWAHDEMGTNFDVLKKLANQGEQSKLGGDSQKQAKKEGSSSETKTETVALVNKSVEDIRKDLFGGECFFCGQIPQDKALVIHRKDGEEHDKEELWKKEQLQNLNLDDWVPLCQRHHRYVHWAMKRINMSWGEIASVFKGPSEK